LERSEAKYRFLAERVPAITYIAEVGRKAGGDMSVPESPRYWGHAAEWIANPDLWRSRLHPKIGNES